jgi:hypothetical protein
MMSHSTFIITAFYGAFLALLAFPTVVSRAVERITATATTEEITDRETGVQGVKAKADRGSYFSSLARAALAISIKKSLLMGFWLLVIYSLFNGKEVGLAVAAAIGGFFICMLVRVAQHYAEIRASIKNGTFRITRKPDDSFKVGGPPE